MTVYLRWQRKISQPQARNVPLGRGAPLLPPNRDRHFIVFEPPSDFVGLEPRDRVPPKMLYTNGLPANDGRIESSRVCEDRIMFKRENFPIAEIYVPTKRRGTLKPEVVQDIAASILEIGQQTPVLVRRDGKRLVLVEGLHRLEACKALGETTILGYLVQARKH
jgi:sulfiredoxin